MGCGLNGVYIRKVKRFASKNNLDVAFYNTKYEAEHRPTHELYLKALGEQLDYLTSVVIYNGEVMRLKNWNL